MSFEKGWFFRVLKFTHWSNDVLRGWKALRGDCKDTVEVQVWGKVTDYEQPCHGGELHNNKTWVCHHLDLAATDVVITSSEAHHDSENILGETFSATDCSVFFGNIFITGCEVKNSIGSSPQDVKRKFLTSVLFRFYEPTVPPVFYCGIERAIRDTASTLYGNILGWKRT